MKEKHREKGTSDSASSARRVTNAAGSGIDERRRIILAAWGIVFALAMTLVLLRFLRLNELPPRLYFDEGAHGVDALHVLQGEHAVFFPENNGREGLIVYAVALSTSFLGRAVLAIRLPTALASAGAVFAVFWLGRLLFGRDEESGKATPWRGLLIGGVGAGLMAVSLGQTVIGRTALRANFLPLLLSLCFALLWWGWRQRSWWRIALAGACAGLLPYSYIAARFTPLLFFLFGLSFMLPWGRSEDEGDRSERSEKGSLLTHVFRPFTSLRAELPWASVFLGVAALVAAPILVYFALHPEDFFLRSSQLSVFQPGRSQGDPLGAFLGNLWRHLLVFGFRGDPNLRYNFPGQPLLNPWEASFFWLGVGMAVWRWQRPAYSLLLLWLGLMLLPAVLSKDHSVPNTLRMIGAAPAIYLLIGVGVWGAFRFRPLIYMMGLMSHLDHLKSPLKSITNITQIKVENEIRAAVALGLVVSGLILVQGVVAHRTYFQKWATSAPEIEQLYWTQWQELTRVLSPQPSAADMAYLIPSYSWHYSFEYLDLSAAPANVVYMGASNLTQNTRSTLADMNEVAAVKVVDWNDDSYFRFETERLVFLLGKYGRFLSSDQYDNFLIHTYTDVALDRPWTFYEDPEPLAVHYDRGISLQGIAVGQGIEQLSSQHPLMLGQARTLWVNLYWETSPELDIDYSISLRLYNAEGRMAYQADDVLWKTTDRAPTSRWSAQEMVDTLHLLKVPADLPAGDYELRLVVYDFETHEPTVELGVWKPELALARLRLSEIQ